MPELFPKPLVGRKDGTVVLRAESLQQIIEAIPRVVTGNGVLLNKYGDRLVVQQAGDYVYQSGLLQSMVVISEQADYLTCVVFNFTDQEQPYDPTLGTELQLSDLTGSLVYVAKPYWLQQTPWDGKTVKINELNYLFAYTGVGERTAQLIDLANIPSVFQQITSAYTMGDVISAQSGPTGLFDSSSTVPNYTGTVVTTLASNISDLTVGHIITITVASTPSISANDVLTIADDSNAIVGTVTAVLSPTQFKLRITLRLAGHDDAILASPNGKVIQASAQPIIWTDINTAGRSWIDPTGPQLRISTTGIINQAFDCFFLVVDVDTQLRTPAYPIWGVDLDGSDSVESGRDFICRFLGRGVGGWYYVSLVDNNTNQALTDKTKWGQVVAGLDPKKPPFWETGSVYPYGFIVAKAFTPSAVVVVATTVIPLSLPATFTVIQQPTIPTILTVVMTDADSSFTGTVTISGRDERTLPVTENISVSGGSNSYDTTTTFSQVDSVTIPSGSGQDGSTDTIEVTYQPPNIVKGYFELNPDGTSGEPGVSSDWLYVVFNDKGGYNTRDTYAQGDYVQEIRDKYDFNSGCLKAYKTAPNLTDGLDIPCFIQGNVLGGGSIAIWGSLAFSPKRALPTITTWTVSFYQDGIIPVPRILQSIFVRANADFTDYVAVVVGQNIDFFNWEINLVDAKGNLLGTASFVLFGTTFGPLTQDVNIVITDDGQSVTAAIYRTGESTALAAAAYFRNDDPKAIYWQGASGTGNITSYKYLKVENTYPTPDLSGFTYLKLDWLDDFADTDANPTPITDHRPNIGTCSRRPLDQFFNFRFAYRDTHATVNDFILVDSGAFGPVTVTIDSLFNQSLGTRYGLIGIKNMGVTGAVTVNVEAMSGAGIDGTITSLVLNNKYDYVILASTPAFVIGATYFVWSVVSTNCVFRGGTGSDLSTTGPGVPYQGTNGANFSVAAYNLFTDLNKILQITATGVGGAFIPSWQPVSGLAFTAGSEVRSGTAAGSEVWSGTAPATLQDAIRRLCAALNTLGVNP